MADELWRKSSYSGPNCDNCVEVASIGGMIAVRDSKDPKGPTQQYSKAAWQAFLAGAKAGEFDILSGL